MVIRSPVERVCNNNGMSLEMAISLLCLAVVDSFNPSALIITGVLLIKSRKEDRLVNILAYVAGIFVSYFILGALLFLGADEFIDTIKNISSSTIYQVVQLVIGLSLLLYAVIAPVELKPSIKKRRELRVGKILGPKLLFFYGAYVTTAELITALPYFAAITLLVNAQVNMVIGFLVIFIYCIIFVLPPLFIALLYHKKRVWFDSWLQSRSDRQKKTQRETFLWMIGIVGFILMAQALQALNFMGWYG